MAVPAPSDLPQQIGPYRILGRLGAGGMGEVFLAYDERLDRRVAVKRIRPDAEVSADRRERFRREAKLAARLSHPAIVQVYDILQEGDFDFIVLEYVEGTSLWEVIEDGPMDVRETLDLARELADGLDAAHRQGIVHRDLKAENVLVTPSGRPKITDFGIAKELLGGDESLTRANAVLGTYRIMSPEQARGEAVDHRTDLFALGVLLYEMLAGRSPFAAENGLATLNRVISFQQQPVREINPVVPEELSSLIDHLLQKDPALRPRGAGQVRRELDRIALTTADLGGTATVIDGVASPPQSIAPAAKPEIPGSGGGDGRPSSAFTNFKARPRLVAAALATLIAVAVLTAYLVFRAPREPAYVAVLAPEVGSAGGIETDLLASGVRIALLQGLVAMQGISPKALNEVDAVSGRTREVAHALSVDEVIHSRLDCSPSNCRISLNRLRGKDGAILWAESFEVPTDDFYLIANAVAGQIRRAYLDHEVRDGIPDLEVSSADLKRFLELRQQFHIQREAVIGPVLQGLEDIRARSPQFMDAYLLEADVARYRFSDSRDPRDLDRAFQRIQEARRLAPGDPQPLLTLVRVARTGGRLDAAEEAIDELERLLPGDALVLESRALLLSERGRPREALALMRTAAERQPSVKRLYNLSFLEYQQGLTDEAREHLRQSLERSPGFYDSLSLLAQIELAYGDVEKAVELYSQLVQRSSGTSELSNLGLAYFTLGRYGEASAIFGRLVEREPRKPVYALNQADTLLMMGRRDAANDLYRRVLELITNDPAATDAQALTMKAQALAHLGEGRQAVAAVQEALALAPNNAQVAYEASLVYTLLGEDNSAVVNAEKALRLGVEPRWFSFSWFDRLRMHPELRDLLRQGAPRPLR